jgi:hypothetical protein
MNKSSIKRIGIIVLLIGIVVAFLGSIGCADVGFTGGNVFEMIKFIFISLIGGLLCWLGGEIISLKSKIS